jgi:signal transduction histidine kinase
VETVAALEPLWVEIDATGIRDALEKIVQNALQYSGNSAVRVELSRIGGEALVVVADSGPGIPADKLADIFGEFEQLSVGPGRTVGGVGLGLAIAKLMVEQHGGRIWAESELGRGSRFYVALKLSRPPVEKYP